MDSTGDGAGAAAPGTARPLLPPDQPIEFDVACQRCTYNLRGLRPDGRCPECGAPIHVSLASELLQFADPAWLKRLALGGRIVQVVAVLVALATVPSAWLAFQHWKYIVAPVFVLSGAVLGLLAGGWLLTSPNPRLLSEERWYANRRIIRAILVPNFVSVATSALVGSVAPGNDLWVLIQIVAGPLGILGLVGIVCLSRYVASLARRLGDQRTMALAKIYAWGCVSMWAAVAFGIAIDVVNIPVSTAGAPIFAPVIPLLIVFGILTLLLPARLVKALQRCREEAGKNWRAA